MSARAFVPLRRAFGLSGQPSRTVGEVAALLEQGQLCEIRGLGPRRIGEIHTCLALAGLLTGGPDGHRHSL